MYLISLLQASSLAFIANHTTTESVPKGQDTYYENLSKHRTITPYIAPALPENNFPTTVKKNTLSDIPQNDTAHALEGLLNELTHFHRSTPTIPGYTIQVYMGPQRNTAIQICTILNNYYLYPRPTLHYKQPYFVTHFGSFLEKLESYPLYISLKKIIPQAIIRPENLPNQPYSFTALCFITTNPSDPSDDSQNSTDVEEETQVNEYETLEEPEEIADTANQTR